MNQYEYYAAFVGLIFLSSIVFCFSNFYHKMPGVSTDFKTIMLISLAFAMVEYSLKVPAMFYFGKHINSVFTYTIIMITIFICLIFYSHFVLKEQTHPITYFTLILIILIIIMHNYVITTLKNCK